MAKTEKQNPFKQHYDKIIVAVVLLALIASLVVLIHRVTTQRDKDQEFQSKVDRLRPEFPDAKNIGSDIYEKTLFAIETPTLISSNVSVFIAPERIWCVSCKWTIKPDAKTCYKCNAPQPEGDDENWDSDGDGIPDSWELQYGLKPFDPSDASEDLDGDGFTNLEEFLSETDPKDINSHPPYIDFLRVDEIKAILFPYTLSGKIKGPNGYKYQINVSNKSIWLNIGDKVEKTGYVIESASTKTEKISKPGMPETEREISVILLKSENGSIELVEGAPPVWYDFEVVLECTKNPKLNPFEVVVAKRGSVFSFDGVEYKMTGVDKNKETVIITNETTKQSWTVTTQEKLIR